MKYKYLVFEGNIGAGKTSLASIIAEKYNAKLILEQFSDNPFLPKFYKDPSRYSFPLELSFLASRYKQLHLELTSPEMQSGFKVADYFFSKSLIFSKITLQPDEFKLYETLFNIIYKQLPKPELFVYIHVSIEKLIENIRKRGREYEKELKPEYLERLQHGYFEYFRTLRKQKVLILDIQDLDFIHNSEDLKIIEETIFDNDYKTGLNHVSLQ
jgi:deoxyguanosine kinase